MAYFVVIQPRAHSGMVNELQQGLWYVLDASWYMADRHYFDKTDKREKAMNG